MMMMDSGRAGWLIKIGMCLFQAMVKKTDLTRKVSELNQKCCQSAVMYNKRRLRCEEKHLSVYLGCVMTG